MRYSMLSYRSLSSYSRNSYKEPVPVYGAEQHILGKLIVTNERREHDGSVDTVETVTLLTWETGIKKGDKVEDYIVDHVSKTEGRPVVAVLVNKAR